MGAICAGCFRFHVTTYDNQILYRSPEVRCSRNGVILRYALTPVIWFCMSGALHFGKSRRRAIIMQNNDNQKNYFIYIRSTGERVPVTREQHDSFYKEADRIRHKEQDHGRCMCPYRFIWKCNGDCIGCEYHAAGDTTSLDQPRPDGNGTLGDYIPDNSKPMDEVIADRMLLEQLFSRLRELDPEADTIIQLWKDHPEGISDRAIARELGRPQKTFADQMKKYRTDLRRITDDK